MYESEYEIISKTTLLPIAYQFDYLTLCLKEQEFMIKMIIMDLDGTLLTDDKNISDYTVSILEKCKSPLAAIACLFLYSLHIVMARRLYPPKIQIIQGAILCLKNQYYPLF
jgi:hypothetical protein